MNSTHAHALVTDTVKKTIVRTLGPEHVWYDVAFSLLPGQDGQPQPFYAIWLSIPSPEIGQRLSTVTLLPADGAGQASAITGAVEEALESLRQSRSEMLGLATPNGAPVQAGALG